MARDWKATAQRLRAKAADSGTTHEESAALRAKATEASNIHDREVRERTGAMPRAPGDDGRWGPTLQQYEAAQRQMDAEREQERAEAVAEAAEAEEAAEAGAGADTDADSEPGHEAHSEPELQAEAG
jgi:hypothetical protein